MRYPTSARGRGGAPHRCMGTRCAPAGAARRYNGNEASCTVLPWAADVDPPAGLLDGAPPQVATALQDLGSLLSSVPTAAR